MRHLLYRPDGDGPFPLVLFLHGGGECGSDLALVERHGPPRRIAEGYRPPAIVVSPQCPADRWWGLLLDELLALIDRVVAAHPVDPDRVLLTGLSMGAYGAWALAARAPTRFAALVPVCGGGTEEAARVLARGDLPIWAFHGDRDEVVPISESERMVDALRASGARRVRFTVYRGVEHDSWTRTYADPAVWDWLLAHRRAI